MTNPLLAAWDTPFGITPFAKISDDDFAPALDTALARHMAEITAIAENPEPPSFANTIEAMEVPVVAAVDGVAAGESPRVISSELALGALAVCFAEAESIAEGRAVSLD